jgi:hypothetical protein
MGIVQTHILTQGRVVCSLMIWKWISTNPSVEHIGLVRVLLDRTEIEHPKVLSVSVLEKLDGILPAIAVQTFNT